MNNPQSIRLNKFLAERLGVSRREADELIASGQVTIDGQTAVLGNKIDSKSKICYNNKVIPHANKYMYLAFNKPVGYVCSRRAQGQAPTLYDLLISNLLIVCGFLQKGRDRPAAQCAKNGVHDCPVFISCLLIRTEQFSDILESVPI